MVPKLDMLLTGCAVFAGDRAGDHPGIPASLLNAVGNGANYQTGGEEGEEGEGEEDYVDMEELD